MVHSKNPKALQQILSDVENTRNALGATACLAKQSTVLYDNLIQVPQNLLDWQSDPKDTATSVDQIIRQWRQVK